MSTTNLGKTSNLQEDVKGPEPVYLFSFTGRGTTLFLEFIKNYLLFFVTFGFWTFKLIVNFRKFVTGNIELAGQRFSYHGTAMELFIGYCKVFGIFLAYSIIVVGLGFIDQTVSVVVGALFAVAMVGLFPFAMYSSKRYKLSRTTWRGVAFGAEDKGLDYAKLCFTNAILTLITFGIWYPKMSHRLYEFRVNNMFWGDAKFKYTGNESDFFWMHIKAIPLMIITLGFYGLWFSLKAAKYQANHTWVGNKTLGAAKFNISHTGLGLIWAWIKFIFFTMITLGFGMSWALCGFLRNIAPGISLQGHLQFDQVKSIPSSGNSFGDALASSM